MKIKVRWLNPADTGKPRDEREVLKTEVMEYEQYLDLEADQLMHTRVDFQPEEKK